MDIKITKNQELKIALANKHVKEDVNIITEVDDYAFKSLVDGSMTKVSREDLYGITNVRDYAFYLTPITEIELPNTVQTIGRNAFANTKLKRFVMPDSVTSANVYICNACSELEEFVIGKGVTRTGNGWVDSCPKLTYLEIPDNVISLAWYFCQRCTALKTIKIGKGIKTIEAISNGCTALKEIICLAETPPTINAQNFNDGYVPADCIIKVPANSVEAYKSATNWSVRADYIIAYEGD